MAFPLPRGITPSEIEFISEMEMVTVVPRQRLDGLDLLSVSNKRLKPRSPKQPLRRDMRASHTALSFRDTCVSLGGGIRPSIVCADFVCYLGSYRAITTAATCDASSLAGNPTQTTTARQYRSSILASPRVVTNNPPIRIRHPRIHRFLLAATATTRSTQTGRRQSTTASAHHAST